MKTMAGVALAAVVGACALGGMVERAEATTINVTASANFDGNYADADFSFVSAGNGFGSGYFHALFYGSRVDQYEFEISSNRVTGTQTSSSCGQGCLQTSYVANFSNVQFGDGTYYGDLPVLVPPTGDVLVFVDIIKNLNPGEFGSALRVSVGSSYLGGTYGDVPITASYSVTAVPLPATAPLLEAALLALAGMTHKRRQTIAA